MLHGQRKVHLGDICLQVGIDLVVLLTVRDKRGKAKGVAQVLQSTISDITKEIGWMMMPIPETGSPGKQPGISVEDRASPGSLHFPPFPTSTQAQLCPWETLNQ